jgi:hypothetical protein
VRLTGLFGDGKGCVGLAMNIMDQRISCYPTKILTRGKCPGRCMESSNISSETVT